MSRNETAATENETADSEPQPTLNGTPYEGVDWDTYGSHKAQFHIHPHYDDIGPPQEVYDRYVELGYDIINIQPKSDLEYGMPWPPEEWGSMRGGWANRSPAEDQVVALPGAEYTDCQHITGFFTELMEERLLEAVGSGNIDNPDHQYNVVEYILDSEPTPARVSPLAFIAHPGRYQEEMSQFEWEQEWLSHYQQMIDDFDRLLGMEAITYSFNYDDREIWDRLLNYAAPDRTVMGTSVDDIATYEDADRGWVTFYLSPDEFAPSDQRATQQRVYDAWASGRTTFSTTAESGMEAPTVESIERDSDAGTISIRGSGYDVIEWVSGDVIGTGETIEYRDNTDIDNYIRAQLVSGNPEDPDSITCTQAWY